MGLSAGKKVLEKKKNLFSLAGFEYRIVHAVTYSLYRLMWNHGKAICPDKGSDDRCSTISRDGNGCCLSYSARTGFGSDVPSNPIGN